MSYSVDETFTSFADLASDLLSETYTDWGSWQDHSQESNHPHEASSSAALQSLLLQRGSSPITGRPTSSTAERRSRPPQVQEPDQTHWSNHRTGWEAQDSSYIHHRPSSIHSPPPQRSDSGWGMSIYPPSFYPTNDYNTSHTLHPHDFWDILNDPSPEQAQYNWAPPPESAPPPPPPPPPPLPHYESNIAGPSTSLPSINAFYDDRQVMPAGSSSEMYKRTRSSTTGSASPELKRLRRTSTNQRKVEEVDLVEPGSAEKLREKQTEDLVKTQQKEEGEKHKGFRDLTCMICMDTFTNMTATHCGHIFCHECLTQAILAGERSSERGVGTCPACRKPVKRSKKGDIIPSTLMKGKKRNAGRRSSKS